MHERINGIELEVFERGMSAISPIPSHDDREESEIDRMLRYRKEVEDEIDRQAQRGTWY